MESIATRSAQRIELRVVHALVSTLDAWMTISNDRESISIPVQTQLGMPIRAVVGEDVVSLREGKLFVHDGGPANDKAAAKPTFGLVQYLEGRDVEGIGQEQFHVRLYAPSDQYKVLWELSARGRLPRQISLQVRGLREDTEWHIAEVGAMLLIEDFSFNFPIGF